MTGFGNAEIEREGRRLSVEIRMVNNRYLDLAIRCPHSLAVYESDFRTLLKDRLTRGHADVYIRYDNLRSDSRSVEVDEGLVTAYLKAAETISGAHEMRNDLGVSTLLRFPDVLKITESEDDEEQIRSLIADVVNLAVDHLIEMRTREGRKIAEDLAEKLETIRAHRETILERAPMVVVEYRDKLKARIEELLSGTAELDEAKLANEVAHFADRCAIDEELVRLGSHISQMEHMLTEEGAVGKKMDFLIQEFNREVNTICSKSNDVAITQAGLALKNEIEKMREQVQNIE